VKSNDQVTPGRSAWKVPGAGKILSDCSITLAVISGIIVVLIIFDCVCSMIDLKLPESVDIGLHFAIEILFIGSLVAVSFEIDVSSAITNLTDSIEWYHSSSISRSASVADYVHLPHNWKRNHTSEPNKSQTFQLPPGWNSTSDSHLTLLTHPNRWDVFNIVVSGIAAAG
jgi:hypothetical protein